ncbi:MAG: GNAT family N-acetyltransferase [Sulfitobacter sp.]|nr:GNAT family N-acetyltransferase [Sulfitobacter sp.]
MFDAMLPLDRSLFQDPAFAAALKECGQAPITLPDGQLLLTRRLFGVTVAMLPRAAPPENLGAQLARLGLHRAPVILSPDHRCPVPASVCLARPRDKIVLDLDRDETASRARLHPKWRNQLIRAETSALRMVQGSLPPDPNHPLLRLESKQARARGYTNWPGALTAAFARAAPHQTLLFSAFCRDRGVAHMLFLLHGERASYHIGYTNAEGRSLHAHNLLLWRASRHLASLGIRQVELGLMQPRAHGLNRFKLRTGARRQPTGGSWLYWHPFARAAGLRSVA